MKALEEENIETQFYVIGRRIDWYINDLKAQVHKDRDMDNEISRQRATE